MSVGFIPVGRWVSQFNLRAKSVELWAIYQMEHDPQVLEFYDQPPPFKIQYKNNKGRNIGHYHTPDFFVLRQEGACWEEWKTVKELEKLSQKYPGRYQKTASDEWRCPPGEAHAVLFGLKYRVRTDAELNEVFTQNLMFLEDYLEFKSNLATLATSQIRELVTDNPGITIAALLSELVGICANDVYIMIACEQLYVDFNDVHIIEHWRTRLWIDQQTYDAYNKASSDKSNTKTVSIYPTTLLPNAVLIWDSQLWTLVNYGETKTTLLPESGFPIELPTSFFLQLFDSGAIHIQQGATDTIINETVSLVICTKTNKTVWISNPCY